MSEKPNLLKTAADLAEAKTPATDPQPQTTGNRYFEAYQRLDLDPLRRGSGDAQARECILAALADYDKLKSTLATVKDVRRAERALADLRSAGIAVSEDLEARAFFSITPDPVLCADVVSELGKQIHERLAAKADPEVKRIIGKLVVSLKSELATVDQFEQALFKRWPSLAISQTALRGTLGEAITRLEAEIAGPLDISWHQDGRAALSGYFRDYLAPVAPAPKESLSSAA